MQQLIMPKRSDKFKYKILYYKKDLPTPKRGEVLIVPQDNRLMDIPPFLPSEQLPSWWKDLPKMKGSLRRCQGTYDYITNGFVIPLWTDVTVRPSINGKTFELKLGQLDGHFGSFEVSGFESHSVHGCPITNIKAIPTGQFPKLVSPWRFRTPKGVSLMVLPILHEPNPNYTVVPGIVHTDFYNQIHVVLNITTDKEFTIPAGTPIQFMVPIIRKNNFKRILWGNESMFRFIVNSGLGEGGLVSPDRNQIYRKKQREADLEAQKEKKWFNFFKK